MASPAHRRQRLIELCASAEHTAAELAKLLRASPRTVAEDLRWAKKRWPEFRSRTDSRRRKLFRFEGVPPVVLEAPIEFLDHDALVAIVAARGLLRLPIDGPAERGASYAGLLDGALHRLLTRSGAEAAAADLAPEAIQVFRFAACAEDPRTLAEVVSATVLRQALRFSYTNRQGVTHDVHAAPLRLVLFRGEFHAFMWTPASRPRGDADYDPLTGRAGVGESGRIKQYRVGRMKDVVRTAEPPPGCPASNEQWRIDRELAYAFETTGSMRTEDRHRVSLLVSPRALPHLEDRLWGGDQQWTEAPSGAPPGWRRLEFTTSGLEACRHWVLGFGSSLRAEQPPELVAWLREEARRLIQELAAPTRFRPIDRPLSRGGRSEAARRPSADERRRPAAPAAARGQSR